MRTPLALSPVDISRTDSGDALLAAFRESARRWSSTASTPTRRQPRAAPQKTRPATKRRLDAKEANAGFAARRRGRRAGLEGSGGGLRVRRRESVAVEDERESGSGNAHVNPPRGAARRRIGGRSWRHAPKHCCAGDATEEALSRLFAYEAYEEGFTAPARTRTGTALVSCRRRRRGRLPRIRRRWRLEESVSTDGCLDSECGRLHGARRGHGIAVPPSRPRAGEAPVAGFFLLSGF